MVRTVGVGFVNVYLRDRNYGGPEEGGWWYDSWEPVRSIAVGAHLVGRLAARVTRVIERWNEGRRPIDSVLSDGAYEVLIEREPAHASPERRPHYE